MSQTFNESVKIDGVADEVQLTVQGHSTQTNPLQVWEDSAANQKARISADGRFQNGDMSVSTPDALIEAHRDSSSSLPKRGFHSLGRIASALSDAVSWLVAELELIGTGTITGLHRVIRAKLTHSSTGDSGTAEVRAGDLEVINQAGTSLNPLGKAVGLQTSIDNQNGAYLGDANGVSSLIKNATGANIETAKAFEVPAVINDGTIDTLIGLDIADMNEGSDNYAIRAGAGKVQFGDLNAGLVKANGDGLLSNAIKGTDFDTLMQGASSGANGVSGDVPQPLAGQENKFLRGDGSWADPQTVTTLDNLSDVATGGAEAGDVLTYNGTSWEAQTPEVEDNLIPVGVTMPFVGSSVSGLPGWLLCDGHAVPQANHADLFTLIGHSFKRLATLASRSSDTAGSIELADTAHGLTVGAATLTLSFALASANISAVNTTSDVITTTAAHPFLTGDRVRVASTGSLPGGLSVNTDYHVRVLSSTTFTLHPSLSDANANTNIINLTSAGSGTRTISPQDAGVRTGMSIDSVSGSVLNLSAGSGHILPAVATELTVECASNYFFLPDMRGRTVIGAGQGYGLSNQVFGTKLGEETHQLTVAEMPAHTHTYSKVANGYTGGPGGGANDLQNVNTSSVGGNQAHNNMQPSFVLNYIVRG